MHAPDVSPSIIHESWDLYREGQEAKLHVRGQGVKAQPAVFDSSETCHGEYFDLAVARTGRRCRAQGPRGVGWLRCHTYGAAHGGPTT
jgi:hypothetical protein